MNLLLYCLGVFFPFHLFNHSDLLKSLREQVVPKLEWHVAYMIQCAFCATWWVSLPLAALGFVPPSWLLGAPVINLFMLKAFHFLDKPSQ